MDHIDRITNIEKRAKRLNLSLMRLCVLSGVRAQYLYRWKKIDGVSPNAKTLKTTLDPLEQALDRIERETAAALQDATPAATLPSPTSDATARAA